jgi:hypothetical protein
MRSEQSDEQSAEQLQEVKHPKARIAHRGICAIPDTIFGSHRGRLAPDFKTIADFRKDNGAAIRAVCCQFVVLCRELGLFIRTVLSIDGSKFKAVNNRDKNYTVAKVVGPMEQVDASIARYLRALDRADREESDIAEASIATCPGAIPLNPKASINVLVLLSKRPIT